MLPYNFFHPPIFFSKKSAGDGGLMMYADLTSWKYAVTYQHIGNKSLILILMLCLPMRGTDSGGDSCLSSSVLENTAHPD